ncbi:scabin-related ADP-ribosyltransferase [Streptomyces avermitilis]|uniref:scabin-related ADP-ribosyltransferase n=1 Tax=Streptomyces avermitilis TaxID=33903 RepID=UPI00381E0CBC
MISPEKIPTFTGDLVDLQQQVAAMSRAARAIREHGGDVHTRFQNLQASYRAPEAGQLFATTQAVESKSSSFADDLETVANALTDYMVEVAEIVRQLESLRGQARVFVASVQDEDGLFRNWQKDQDKVDEHQAIWDDVNAAVAAFQQAEVTCADKITARVGGTQWNINDGSPKQDNAYGFSAAQLAQADKLPWGTPAHHEVLPFGIDYHLEQFGISLKDNVVGTFEGMVNLFSPGEEGHATREGLVRMIVGAESYLLDPYGDRENFGPWQERFMDESRPDAKEFAKGLVGWDDWADNPGKAAGTLVFNGLTLGAGPLGATAKGLSAAGKGGAGARVAGTLATVGEVLDPIGAAAKTVSTVARALPTIRELTTGVYAATDAAAAADATHSTLRLADGSEVRIGDGEFIPGKNGVPDTTPARPEPPASQRTPSVEAPRARDRELVGAGARGNDATAQVGETPKSSHDGAGGAGNSTSHDPGELPSNGGGDAHSGTEGTHTDSGQHPGAGGSSNGGHGNGSDSTSPSGMPGDEPDRLAVATDRSVDLDQLGIPVVWREGHEPLYRSENRSPDVIFENGFEPKDPSNTSLAEYVAEDDPSAFVSTSYREDIGDDFGGKFTYVIDAPGGIDVNRSLGSHPLDYEEEVAFPGGVRGEYIKGAYSYDYATGELGEFIPNPNYRPEAERVT